MKPDLKRSLQEAFEPPKPTGKKEFLKTIGQPRMSHMSFMWSQMEYIPKYVWVTSGITFGIALIGGCFLKKDVLWIISALIPFIALSVTAGNARSDVCLMSELEMTARFSLKSVILARMGILGISHLFLLIFLIPVCAVYHVAPVLQTGLYLLVPYMLTVSAGLWAARKSQGMETMYLCMGIAVSVSGMNLFIRSIFPFVYGMQYTAVWLITAMILILSVIKEMRINMKRTEELAWN